MKVLKQSIIFFILLTVVICGIYPVIVTGFATLLYKEKSTGGIITNNNQKVGADLIGQEFVSDKYFWSRPSAVGFNATASGGSNNSLTSKDLEKNILERKAHGKDFDLLTTSASGLDPHISPEAAIYQIGRIALVRGIDAMQLTKIVERHIEKRQWGFLGEERVNVLRLNLELETMAHE